MIEQFQIGQYSVTVKSRLAEGGFGFVDLVHERSGRELVVRCPYPAEHLPAYPLPCCSL